MHATAEKLRDRLAERGLHADVRELPDSTRTAADAAAGCGCEVGQIETSVDELLAALPAASVRPV